MDQKLLSLPGVTISDVKTLDDKLKNPGSDPRAQKDAVRNVLRKAAVAVVRNCDKTRRQA